MRGWLVPVSTAIIAILILLSRFPFAAETVLAVMPGLLPPGKWLARPDLNREPFLYERTATYQLSYGPLRGWIAAPAPTSAVYRHASGRFHAWAVYCPPWRELNPWGLHQPFLSVSPSPDLRRMRGIVRNCCPAQLLRLGESPLCILCPERAPRLFRITAPARV